MSARTKFRYGKDHMEEAYYADFFRDCESDGWIVAMDRLTSRPDIIKPQKISEFLSNQKRNDFVFLLPIGPGGSALDYGSGYGNTSFTLSHYCERVVAVEADRQRLRFSAAHFSHAGARNILPMAGGGSTSLPFEDESFDTVVLNGVLEWTATTIEGHPRDVHLSLLKEIRRVLRPSGSVAISIENRYSYKWFTGIRDHHAGGLRWVSFLPRRLADIYSRVRLRRPYRTWFYSYRALIRLLSEAGLNQTKIYSYHPNHVTFTHLFRIDRDKNARRVIRELRALYKLSWRDRLVYALVSAGLPYRWVAHDYMAIASKPGTSESVEKSILHTILEGTGYTPDDTLNLRSTPRAVLLELSYGDTPDAMLKVLRAPRWNRSLETESAVLRHYADIGIDTAVHVPEIRKTGTAVGRAFIVSSHVPGLPSINLSEKAILDAGLRDWLIAMGKAALPATQEPPQRRWWAEARAAIDGAAEAPAASSRLANMRGVCVHGDLSPNNVLSHEAGLSVVDWEFGDPDGLPLIDLIDFLLYCRNRETRSYRQSWADLFDGADGAEDNVEVRRYCEAVGITEDLVPELLDQFLVKKIALLAALEEPISVRKRAELIEILASRQG